MKYQIRPIFDKNLWESYHLSFTFPSLFQSWSIGETEKKCGHEVDRLGFYKKDKLLGIAQVITTKAKRGRFLHIRGGPLFKDLADFPKCFPILKKYFQNQHVAFIRISPPILADDSKNITILSKMGFIDVPIPLLDAEVSWILDIDKDQSQLLSQMRKTTRYLIRKAQKIGVVVTQAKDEKAIEDLLELYKIMVKEKGIIPHKGIREEFTQLVKNDQAVIFRGYYNNKLLGAALIIFYGDEGIYHHSAHLRTKEDIPVSYLLQWEAILESKRRKKKRYNFWGIEPSCNKRHPWYGLSLFKMGYGGYMRRFIRAKDLPLSPFYALTWLIESLRRIKRYKIYI